MSDQPGTQWTRSIGAAFCLYKICVEWLVLVKGRRGKGGEEERFRNCGQRMK